MISNRPCSSFYSCVRTRSSLFHRVNRTKNAFRINPAEIFNIYLKRLNINLTDENEQYYQEEDNQDNHEYEEDHDPHEEINAQRKNSHNSNDEETKQSDI